jgi:hypothetical protein
MNIDTHMEMDMKIDVKMSIKMEIVWDVRNNDIGGIRIQRTNRWNTEGLIHLRCDGNGNEIGIEIEIENENENESDCDWLLFSHVFVGDLLQCHGLQNDGWFDYKPKFVRKQKHLEIAGTEDLFISCVSKTMNIFNQCQNAVVSEMAFMYEMIYLLQDLIEIKPSWFPWSAVRKGNIGCPKSPDPPSYLHKYQLYQIYFYIER